MSPQQRQSELALPQQPELPELEERPSGGGERQNHFNVLENFKSAEGGRAY